MNIKFIFLLCIKVCFSFLNIGLRKCENCVHFIDYSKDNNINNNEINKCKKFYKHNLSNDEIIFESIINCRQYDYLCGIKGKFFEEKPTEIIVIK